MTHKSGLADSPFFKAIETQPVSDANTRTPVRTPERVNTRTPEHANTRTGERKIIRHSFNIYQDQLETLRRRIATKSLQGEPSNLSDLVRESLDQFLNGQP